GCSGWPRWAPRKTTGFPPKKAIRRAAWAPCSPWLTPSRQAPTRWRDVLRLPLLQCPVACISLERSKMAEVLNIESLDLEARGVAHRDGKVVFVEGALPGERVVA